ncbi:type II secretion system protein [Exiguobacterium flavidum]|uniref:type II secretion system protein n=1 Tax=Exiguobacterium flavidum TaxID=2184695 RepID=UPI0013003652|nr:type II secretion system protein [Exiguobacterium flavidum]
MESGRPGSEGGFTLLEVTLAIAVFSGFLVLAIDPFLKVERVRMELVEETDALSLLASDQVEGNRASYVVREGEWCADDICLAYPKRNFSP